MQGKALYLRMREEFDFSPVLDTAVREVGVPTREKAKEILDAFLQWFSLIPMVNADKALQMLRGVDKIWHAFILNTRLYREFCRRYVGFYVDHDPMDVNDSSLPKEQYAAFTLKLLKEEFGDEVQPSLELLAEGATCCLGCKSRTDVVSPSRQDATRFIELVGA